MLFAASCTEDNVGTDNGNEAQVTFNLGLEGQSGTRATIGDGTSVTDLHYAVFDADGNRLTQIAKVHREDEFSATDKTANVSLKLAKDQWYTVVFWAQHKAADYTIDDNMVVTVSYDAESNNENRDAFFKAEKFKVTGSESINVVLTRPFAQLNVGVTEADFNAAVASGVEITKSWAKVTGVYNTLNLLNGEVVGNPTTAEFALAAIPTQALTVGNTEYVYLSMNYVLVGQRENVAAEFKFENEDGSKGINFNSGLDVIPVERNFRTNLVGQILTGNLDFNVIIKPAFQNDENMEFVQVVVNTASEVAEAIANAETGKVNVVVFKDDIDLNDLLSSTKAAAADPSLTIPAGKVITFDLNGKKLSATSKQSGNREMFLVKGTLNVVNGTVTYEHKGANMGWNAMSTLFDVTAGGVLNLNGVTAKNLGGTDMSFVAHLNNWGTATLNVENCTLDAPYIAVRVFNSGNDMNNVTIKNSTLKGKYCFWVHNYKAAGDGVGEDATLNINIFNGTNELKATNSNDNAPVLYGFNKPIYYFSDGLAKNDKTYTVTNANGLVALAKKGLKAGEAVKLGANIDLKGVEFNGLDTFHPENNNTFDGQDYTVSNWTNNSGESDMGFIRNWVGTIKNVKFENCHLKTAGRSAIAAAKVYGNIENVTVNNCSIEDSFWACGIIAGLYNAGNISDCTVTNSSVKSNGGTGAIVGVINESAGTRSLTNCKVEGCIVNNTGAYGETYSGALICGMINISNSTVEFNNCTYENNTKEGKFVGDLYYSADKDITVKIDGKTVVKVSSVDELNKLNAKNAYVILTADIDFQGAAMTKPIELWGNSTFDGNGHKISNVKTAVQGNYATSLFRGDANPGNKVVKNLVIENLTTPADYNYAAAIWSDLQSANIEIENVHINNATIEAKGTIGGFVGFVSGGTTSVVIKNSSINDSNLNGGEADHKRGAVVGRAYGCSATCENVVVNNVKINDVATTTSTLVGDKGYTGTVTVK